MTLLTELRQLKKLLLKRKSFEGHAGRIGKRGGSMKKGQTHAAVPTKPMSAPLMETPPITGDKPRKLTKDERADFLLSAFDRPKLEAYAASQFGQHWKQTHHIIKMGGNYYLVHRPDAPDKIAGLMFRPDQGKIEEVKKQQLENFDAEGIQPKEVKALLGAMRKKVVDHKPISIRRTSDATLGIIEAGRFKTQFETHKSHGMYDPAYRAEAEERGLGVPQDVDPKLRPVYGYISQTENDATSYGNVEFILKPEVNFRATLTIGDSLGDFGSRHTIGTPVADPGIEGFTGNGLAGVVNMVAYEDKDGKPRRNATTSWDRAFANNTISYIECQVQGGVSIKDVDKVIIHLNKYEADLRPTEQEAHDKLKALGIPVEVAKNSW